MISFYFSKNYEEQLTPSTLEGQLLNLRFQACFFQDRSLVSIIKRVNFIIFFVLDFARSLVFF